MSVCISDMFIDSNFKNSIFFMLIKLSSAHSSTFVAANDNRNERLVVADEFRQDHMQVAILKL